MNSRSKGTPKARGRARLERKTEAKPCAQTTSSKYTAASTATNDSSLLSEGEGNQAPQTWEERAEMDIQYSKYLQAKLLEKIMSNNSSLITFQLENQRLAFTNKEKQELEEIQTLQQRMATSQELVKEEALLDQLIPQLQSLVDKVQKLTPQTDQLTQAVAKSADQLTTCSIQLPVSQEEKEKLVSSLEQLAAQNKETHLSEQNISSQLSDLAQQLNAQTIQSNISAQNLQEKLVPSSCKQLALIMYENKDEK